MKKSILSLLRIRKFFYFYHLKRMQWLKEDEIKKRQEKKLRRIINHAYKNILFYQEVFDSIKLNPYDIKTLNDLKKIPILTKEDVRNNYPDKIIAKGTNFKNCHISSTTGSTGIPLKICFSLKERDYFYASNNYIHNEIGIKFFHKIVTIRHSPTIATNNWRNKLNVLARKNISIFYPLNKIIDDLYEGYIEKMTALDIEEEGDLFTTDEELDADIQKSKKELIRVLEEEITRKKE